MFLVGYGLHSARQIPQIDLVRAVQSFSQVELQGPAEP